MIKKTLEELKNLLSKSTADGEPPAAQEDALPAAEQEPITTTENEPSTEEKSMSDTVEVVEVNVSKSMESLFTPRFEKIVEVLEEFRKSLDAIKQENAEVLNDVVQAVKAVAEEGGKLQKSLEELEKRLSRLEATPNTRKSIQSDVEVKERFGKSQDDYRTTLNKLTNLAIQGKIDPADVPKFELTKSIDSLSFATRRLLESN